MCAKKYEFIGGLKWGYNRKKMCKNIHRYFYVNFLKKHLKRNEGSRILVDHITWNLSHSKASSYIQWLTSIHFAKKKKKKKQVSAIYFYRVWLYNPINFAFSKKSNGMIWTKIILKEHKMKKSYNLLYWLFFMRKC